MIKKQELEGKFLREENVVIVSSMQGLSFFDFNHSQSKILRGTF